ncbi:MAG: hypothetical protein BECKG1743D_GA0114223_108781 [Candidatus Kentron sp. G]|nr:MAG: hypothetical protein BECKG1743D_GA0114223_108781 [Candidatus Kentron sp. G]
MPKSEVSRSQVLIGEFSLLPITPVISSQAYEWLLMYSKSHGLLIPDALIASTAFVHQMHLMTDKVISVKEHTSLLVLLPSFCVAITVT